MNQYYKLFLLLILFSFTSRVHSQEGIYEETIFAGSSEIISKAVDDDHILKLYDRGDSAFFAYCTISTLEFIYAPIPTEWEVLDFQVLNGIVCFCGKDTQSGIALLGYFDLSDLMTINQPVMFVTNSSAVLGLTCLNKLALKDNNNSVSVMAIGRSDANDPNVIGADKMLYMFDITSGEFAMFYSSLYGIPLYEAYWDVLKTDKFFILVGTTHNQSDSLVLRTFVNNHSTYDMAFNNDQPPWQYFIYSPDDFQYKVQAIHTNKDTIVITSIIDSGDSYRTRAYVVDVGDFQPGQGQTVNYTLQSFETLTFEQNSSIAYLDGLNRVAITNSIRFDTVIQVRDNDIITSDGDPYTYDSLVVEYRNIVVYVDPTASSAYNATCYYSIDNARYPYLTATGDWLYASNNSMWYNKYSYDLNTCFKSMQHPVNLYGTQTAQYRKDGYWDMDTFVFTITTVNNRTNNYNPFCQ